jgi:hypothetical protein
LFCCIPLAIILLLWVFLLPVIIVLNIIAIFRICCYKPRRPMPPAGQNPNPIPPRPTQPIQPVQNHPVNQNPHIVNH